jgi:quinolinate synthase
MLNTPAAVKALSDVCCTAANALDIVEAVAGDTVIMVPDQYLAQNTARRTRKKIVTWAGACEVHETFTAADIAELRAAYPTAKIIAHPECPPEVIAGVDYVGATTGMIEWLKAEKPDRVVMVTECSMSDNVAAASPGVEFLRGCNICPHMKRISLENILWSLHTMSEEVLIEEPLIEPAACPIRVATLAARQGSIPNREACLWTTLQTGCRPFAGPISFNATRSPRCPQVIPLASITKPSFANSFKAVGTHRQARCCATDCDCLRSANSCA